MAADEVLTTRRQRAIMRHALGVERHVSSGRNYYCSPASGPMHEDITRLVELGLMARGDGGTGDPTYYAHVTEAGIAELDLDEPSKGFCPICGYDDCEGDCNDEDADELDDDDPDDDPTSNEGD